MPAPHHSSFLQDGCPSCHPTNSVEALKAESSEGNKTNKPTNQQKLVAMATTLEGLKD